MSDNRINPATADRKNPYADLGPRDPNFTPAEVGTAPGTPTMQSGGPMSRAPGVGAGGSPQQPVNPSPGVSPYPNPLAQTPRQVTNPWVRPPSYPPQGPQKNPWASPTPQTPIPQSPVSQNPASRTSAPVPEWNQNVPLAAQSTPAGQATQRPKRRWVMALVVGIIALLIGFAMGESSAKQESQAQIDDLWAENYDLRSELDDRDNRIETLRQQLAENTDTSSSPTSPTGPADLDPWWDFGSNAEGTEGFPGDGVYMIGFDIEAGTYLTAGREGCMWTRVTGDFSIEDVSGTADLSTEVVIDPSDLAFVSTGCADWVRVE